VLSVVAAAALRPVRRVEVRGKSMQPTLEPGDRLLVVRTKRPLPGELVVVADPREPSRELVKRVADEAGGTVLLVGDNRACSTDGRDFGRLPLRAVRARVLYRYSPAARSGWLAPPARAPRGGTRAGQG
jgi:nickel-type superoxide dismutase maturation protease